MHETRWRLRTRREGAAGHHKQEMGHKLNGFQPRSAAENLSALRLLCADYQITITANIKAAHSVAAAPRVYRMKQQTLPQAFLWLKAAAEAVNHRVTAVSQMFLKQAGRRPI